MPTMKWTLQRSAQVYSLILGLYPAQYRQEFGEEMQFVFLELLKDGYQTDGYQGIVGLWGRTLVDAFKTVLIEHIENQREGNPIENKTMNFIPQSKSIVRIALVVGLILLIPLVLTIRDGGVEGVGWNWRLGDFIVMGTLLFGTGLALDFALKKLTNPIYQVIASTTIIGVLFLVWVELAVNAVSQMVTMIL